MLLSIQFLRFFASFCVTLHHSAAEKMHIDVFAAGVDLFFVISGFVITHATRHDETAKSFVLKRIIRVYPMYWFCTIAFISMKYAFWWDLPNFWTFTQSMLLVPTPGQGWLPLYFPGWTLVYEVAFYTLFALVMIVARSYSRQIVALALLGLVAVMISVPGGKDYLGTSLLLEFAFGIAIAESLPKIQHMDARIAMLAAVTSIVIFTINYGGHSMPTRSLAWGIPSSLMVIAAIRFEDLPLFKHRIIQRLGASSYAIYLVHITVLIAIEESLKRHGFAIKEHPLLALPVFLISSIAVGVATNAIIERPLLKFCAASCSNNLCQRLKQEIFDNDLNFHVSAFVAASRSLEAARIHDAPPANGSLPVSFPEPGRAREL